MLLGQDVNGIGFTHIKRCRECEAELADRDKKIVKLEGANAALAKALVVSLVNPVGEAE